MSNIIKNSGPTKNRRLPEFDLRIHPVETVPVEVPHVFHLRHIVAEHLDVRPDIRAENVPAREVVVCRTAEDGGPGRNEVGDGFQLRIELLPAGKGGRKIRFSKNRQPSIGMYFFCSTFGWSSFFGMVTIRTPFSNFALMSSSVRGLSSALWRWQK